MNRFVSLLLFILTIFSFSVFAQDKKSQVVKFAAPKYPAAARAVRASGTVDVNLKIDKIGKVISAEAVSGHPLLRKACELAAKEWVFSSNSTLEIREIKITFLLRVGAKNKKDKIRFKKPYTLELIGAQVRIVNTINT